MFRRLAAAVIAASALAAAVLAAPARAQQLIMVEEVGCYWCAQWNTEIAPIYPKTAEGRIAPLRRIDIHAPVPDDLEFTSPPYFTPTFILVRNGKELGRIEGYPGEDFFWGLLGMMLEKATGHKGAS